MNKTLQIVIGVLLVIGAIWGGAIAHYHYGHIFEFSFAITFSAFVVGVAGAAVIIATVS